MSRTQYQYVLQDSDAAELGVNGPREAARQDAGSCPMLTDVASDQQANGLELSACEVDRDKASRFSVLTQAVDDTLYDAFGQRQVSVIYTQLNQYRVILEVEPGLPQLARCARKNLRQIDDGPVGAAEFAIANITTDHRAALHSAPGTISRPPRSRSTCGPAAF